MDTPLTVDDGRDVCKALRCGLLYESAGKGELCDRFRKQCKRPGASDWPEEGRSPTSIKVDGVEGDSAEEGLELWSWDPS